MQFHLIDEVKNTTFVFDTYDHDKTSITKWLNFAGSPTRDQAEAIEGLAESLIGGYSDAYDYAQELDVKIAP